MLFKINGSVAHLQLFNDFKQLCVLIQTADRGSDRKQRDGEEERRRGT